MTTPLLLTDCLGARVVGPGGTTQGRTADLVVSVDARFPYVEAVVVRSGRRWPLGPGKIAVVPWADVGEASADRVLLRAGVDLGAFEVDPAVLALEAPELLLGRDVLDTQVVDLQGHRVARVSEVVLGEGEGGALEVIAVDVGAGALLRRLLPGRRSGSRLTEQLLGWRDLHLTSSRGHVAQLSTPAAAVHRVDAATLAHLLTTLSAEQAADVMRLVGPERTADAVALSHPDVRSRLGRVLHPGTLEAHPLRHRRFRRFRGWRARRPGDRR